MLLGLHVKNLALIERADVEFTDGLNILTGETGAGKSIIIGSVGLALGAKASKDMIRQGEESALIELVFSVDDERKQSALKALDIVPDEDHQVIVSKKITQTRSMSRINDETVTAARLRSVTSLLLDIHGQHEHQSLLHRHKHLEILDEYSRKETGELKKQTAESYGTYMALKEALSGFGLNEEERRREMDFLRFEIEEIEQAEFKDGEEEALAARYRKFSHGQRIAECMQTASQAADSDLIGRALKDVESVVAYDGELQNILNQLTDAESLLNDLSRSIGDYMNEMEFDEAEFKETEERLDLIRGLMAKYGSTEEAVKNSLMKKKERLAELEHYEERLEETKLAFAAQEKELSALCEQLSEARKQAAGILKEKIEQELEDLNFLHVDFQIEVRRLNGFSAGGFDEVEFLISTNPGNIPPRPLGEVASGGELSRIMLAIKTVLADTDDIPTLIFDEIDTGISGKTAWKVSEKMGILGRNHQIICITHLPQIAAMSDVHFLIEKNAKKERTVTTIRKISEEDDLRELARMLGGAEITEAALQNAKEMKELARNTKLY